MTIVFTAASPKLIVTTADSAVTLEFGDSREYELGRKSYFFSGVGCVMTWGARDHNTIGRFLDQQQVTPQTHDVLSLADLVQNFLVDHYRPSALGLDDVGYHVAGFDRQANPRLFHIFYGFDRPRPPDQLERKYERYDHSPQIGTTYFLYNGRNDLAQPVIQTLIAQLQSGRDSRFDLSRPSDVARFGDFVARFASEFTPEVAPPFLTFLIASNNLALKLVNQTQAPLNDDQIVMKLRELGYKTLPGPPKV